MASASAQSVRFDGLMILWPYFSLSAESLDFVSPLPDGLCKITCALNRSSDCARAPGSRLGQFCPILERPNHQECMYLVQAHEGLFVHIKAVL